MARTFAARFASAHHRLAHAGHDGADVGEVEINQALFHHEIGDAGDAGAQNVVSHGEGIGEGGLLVGDAEQILVGDDEQRIDEFLQRIDTGLSSAEPARALELERLGDDADSEDAFLTRGACDHWRRARSRTAPHAGGDEHHVAADEMGLDVGHRLLGGGGAHLGLGTCAKPLGDIGSHLNAALGG